MNTFETELLVRDRRGNLSPFRGKSADRPVSIYEVHPASWMRVPEEHNRPLLAAELGPKLADYVSTLGFTHVQLMAGGEFPDAYSTPALRQLTDVLREHGLGVILEGLPPDANPAQAVPSELRHFEGVADLAEHLHADGVRDGRVTFLSLDGRELALKQDRRWTGAILHYLGQDPLFRKFHHGDLFAGEEGAEDSILALTHEDVATGRLSLLAKMPGDEWKKFANLRLLLSCQWAQPGKKLLFMGGEFGQWNEWNSAASLDWHLPRGCGRHRRLQQMVADLNRLYREESALQNDREARGMEWGERTGAELSTVNWLRRGPSEEIILAAFNFTPVPRYNHRVGVPRGGNWLEVFNSDAREYGGSGQGNLGGVEASPLGWQQHPHSLTITLPPLGAVFLKVAGRS